MTIYCYFFADSFLISSFRSLFSFLICCRSFVSCRTLSSTLFAFSAWMESFNERIFLFAMPVWRMDSIIPSLFLCISVNICKQKRHINNDWLGVPDLVFLFFSNYPIVVAQMITLYPGIICWSPFANSNILLSAST